MPSEQFPLPHDVRMRGFARRVTVEAAVAWVEKEAKRLGSERVSVWSACGRVLAAEVVSGVAVPGFARSMMDGYAVRGADTLGATAYGALELQIVGQALPGAAFAGSVERGEAVRIMTGAPLPAGADAVVPAEHVEVVHEVLRVLEAVPPGKHVGQAGEDVVCGTAVLPTGRVLRPQDLGLLSSIGASEVEVVRQPRVRIVITGNELLPAGARPEGMRIVDANGPMLKGLVERDGGLPVLTARVPSAGLTGGAVGPHPGPLPEGEGADSGMRSLDAATYVVPDEPAAILAAMQSDADVVLVSGGSSVGQEDHAPLLLAEHGELAIHGVAMRPSSPAGMGRLGTRLVFLLPGNPVSCLCAYDFFAGRAIRLLGGRPAEWPYRRERLTLSRKLVSQVGRVDYARVRIVGGEVEPVAISGASILSSTTIADGFVVVPADSEGAPAGTEVEVWRY